MPPPNPMMQPPAPQQPPKPKKDLKGKLRKPNPEERDRIGPFIDNCNIWSQSLEEVMRAAWYDINSIDDCFIYIAKEYVQGERNEIMSKPIEIRRLNPSYIVWDLDQAGLPKNTHFLCYIHREEATIADEPGHCDVCGNDLIPAMYKYYYHGEERYFFESEVIHESKFLPSETYGYSPILTLINKILTIRGMDLNLYRYFFERRMPASLLMVSTDDAESLKREREHLNSQMRKDPNYIPMVAVSTKQQRGRVDLVKLFHTLQEMEYLNVREEIRDRIAAMWGVTPVWQSAVESSGGMQLQSQQLMVMSRVVESDQRLIKEKIFPKVTEAFGITDWELDLLQPEEKAEATRISLCTTKNFSG